ncbi:MAG: hypothetical protein FJ271_04755 [Planctomycetes bacterium]|nr:hypothetical protein [Planctomycetota bacterium]
MAAFPICRVVLYKHGIGYFEREGSVAGDSVLSLTFKQAEVSDVLKSLTVLDLDGGHVASVSYDSTKPLEQLLEEVALSIPEKESVVGLLPQIKGARVALHSGVADPVEGILLGVDTAERQYGDGIVRVVLVSILTDKGEVRSFDLHALAALQILDPVLRRDLDYYLRTQLSSKKKDARTFSFFAQGKGERRVRLSYTLGAPVWKATYRILLGEEGKPPMIQGWAVVDNTQDEDWENVQLSLIAGLPVSFIHDLYTPRYIRRPEVKVQETTGVLPPMVEDGMPESDEFSLDEMEMAPQVADYSAQARVSMAKRAVRAGAREQHSAVSSMPTQVRERKIGDLFEYQIEHPVTIRRNQSALVPIVLRAFEGRPVLLYNKATRAENPMRCVEFKNTTELTLEGGPVTVLEGGSYVGEAMLETLKPAQQRLVPYAVELSVHVLDNVNSHDDKVHRIVMRRGIMQAHYLQVRQTAYTFNNKGTAEYTIYVDHPREGREWKLFETAEPVEITENFWRFRFSLPAGKVSNIVIRQKHAFHHHFALADTSENQLALWIEQRYLDKKTEALLRQVIEIRQEAAAHEQAINTLRQEREQIHAEQKRIRENLQSLGDRTTEKDLRERFVRTLNAQEDRLEKIDAESKSETAARDKARQKIADMLGKLDYDAERSAV